MQEEEKGGTVVTHYLLKEIRETEIVVAKGKWEMRVRREAHFLL